MKDRFFHNYHTHTEFCRHASATVEENIIKAIENNWKTIGFSEHVFYEGKGRTYRLRSEKEFNDYLNEIKIAKEKYGHKIEILTALECEWLPEYYDFYKSLKDHPDIDYLVLGHHGDSLHELFITYVFDDIELIKRYCKGMKDAINSGLFKYIAHPDVFCKQTPNPSKEIINECAEFIKLAKEKNVPLGLNGNGYYGYLKNKSCFYPNKAFWDLVVQLDAPVLLELDAHSVDLWDESFAKKLFKLAKDWKINPIEKLNF